MRIGFNGEVVDTPAIRAGFIGCGSHAFRNVYPTFQFAPVDLVAVCDLDPAKADAFASQFGAEAAYTDHHAMLDRGDLDAVYIVVGYDDNGRPLYPSLAIDCLDAGKHVWFEKPPAATAADVEGVHAAAARAGKQAMVGFKKMFFPANEKARMLARGDDFGVTAQVTTEYPQYVPTVEQFDRYSGGEKNLPVMFFLDHLCHPASNLLNLLGAPATLSYERARNGAASATLTYDSGAIAQLALTWGAAAQDGLERTTIVGDNRHIVVDNNRRVTYHRMPYVEYGATPDFYASGLEDTTLVWEPEFSLGQLYNKGLFLLGYYAEVNEFATAILEERAVAKAGLDDAWLVTHLFEAFAKGPGEKIALETKAPWKTARRGASGARGPTPREEGGDGAPPGQSDV
jgi:predicted dehydrogenase